MKIIDLEKINVVETKEYEIKEIFLPIKSFMELNVQDFSQVFKKLVNKKMKEVELKDNIILVVRTDLFKSDFQIMRDTILNHIVNFILEPEQRDREARLGIPKKLLQVDMTSSSIMDLINRKTKINRFNISITAKNNIGRSSLI